MAKFFSDEITKLLIQNLTLVAFSLLFSSLSGCSSGETPKNLISNGSFEENIGAWSINKTEVLRMRAVESIRFQTRKVNQHLDKTELTRPQVVQKKNDPN